MRFLLVVVMLALSLTACPNPNPNPPPAPPPPPPGPSLNLDTQEVASGANYPIQVVFPPNTNEMYVVEQGGTVRIVNGGTLGAEFMNISDRVSNGNEEGLLSIAFHPNYGLNGYVFAYYTDKNGDNRVVRFTANTTTKDVDESTEKLILAIPHPNRNNHNGGFITFGPGGFLYIGTGDGGGGGDPDNNAQNTNSLLGKLLRIDVTKGDPYATPNDNPYKNGGGKPEIWTVGLRNPWRYSFDRQLGDLWIGDVGQDRLEEVNFRSAGTSTGTNFGWPVMEGTECFNKSNFNLPLSSCNKSGKALPVYEYSHTDNRCSVTGGYVYRGTEFAAMIGKYFFADFCRGTIWSLTPNASGGFTSKQEIPSSAGNISSFGEGPNGELYVVRPGEGKVYKLIAK